jgi:acetolactate synthase regulatory subunit
MRNLARLRGTAVVTLVLVGLLAGCSASRSGDSTSAADSSAGKGGSALSGAAPQAGAGTEQVTSDASGRQVITTGSVQLTVDDPRKAASAVVALVEGEGGRVDARREQAAAEGTDASAQLTVRIPSDDLTSTLAKLEDIGRVDQINLSAQDVTGTAEDLDARIRALKLSVARMEDLLSRATSNADLIAAENALTERQANLESLQSQRARLAEQVALSTLDITLTTPGNAPEPTTHGFLGGVAAGWDALVAMLSALVLVVGVLLPWLAFAGVIVLVVVASLRWVRRRRAPAAVATGPAPTALTEAAPGEAAPTAL